MRRHTKASTAGSTQRQAKGLGRAARWSALPFVLVFAILALPAATATAATAHPFLETFGSAAQPAFSEPVAMATDPSSGDLLVVDKGTGSISRYNPDGTAANFSALGTNVIDGQGTGNCATVPADCDETPAGELALPFEASEIQIAVAPPGSASGTAGDIYVTGPNQIYVFAPDGHYLGRLNKAGTANFGGACGVAVDESGAVYVGDYSNGVHKYVPSANPPVNTDNAANFTSVEESCTLAAGAGASASSLFVTTWGTGSISKISATTGALRYVVGSSTGVLSVDFLTGHLYAGAITGNSPPFIREVVEYDVSDASGPIREGDFTLASNAQGIASNGTNGHVYVDRSGDLNVKVYATLLLPEVVTGTATNVTGTETTLNGTVNPEGEPVTECFFEYGTSTSYGQTAACAESPASIGSGSSPVPAHADLSGLLPETFYHYRLVAASANGMSNGADQTVKTVSLPAVGEEWNVSAVGTEATVKAVINPGSAATTFHVEYGPNASYGQNTAETAVGSDSSDHTVTVNLTGLVPNTTYHWRVVASNEVGEGEGGDRVFTTFSALVPNTSCPNQAFRVGPAAALPDCRGYEMVSPVDKNNGDIVTLTNITGYRTELNQSSLNGDKLTYSSYKAFAGAPANRYTNQYIASRGDGGWRTESIEPPQGLTIADKIVGGGAALTELDTLFRAFSPDLSTAWLVNTNLTPLAPGAANDYPNLYRRDNDHASYEALTTEPLTTPSGLDLFLEFQGKSLDGSHAIYGTQANLTPNASGENSKLYEFSNGELSLVSVLPNGEAAGGAWAGGGTEGASHGETNLTHAISDDGSRIFWTSEDVGGSLFVTVEGETSIPIAQSTPGHPTDRPFFQGASSDGSTVLYTQEHKLYEFDVDAETHTQIAGEMAGHALPFGGDRGDSAVVGASDDLSYIYFVSMEDLADGATAGEPNLYLDHNGTFSLVATLSTADALEVGVNAVGWAANSHDSRVTPDGRHVAFMSDRSLTGYDNWDTSSGKPALELYVYDADTAHLTCASCNPSGARPVAQLVPLPFYVRDDESSGLWAAAWIPTSEDSLHAPRPLSDDGNRLFFNSYDALLPQDTNGVMDVYEWEAQGSGDCKKVDGCIGLISSGTSPRKSEFVEAAPSGRDVFFRTSSSLVPQDPGLIDIYDARAEGGFPSPVELGPCIGDSCQSPPPAPNDPTPASAGFRGAGSPKPHKVRGNCRARGRHAKTKAQRQKQRAKHCKRAKRRAGR